MTYVGMVMAAKENAQDDLDANERLQRPIHRQPPTSTDANVTTVFLALLTPSPRCLYHTLSLAPGSLD